MYCHTLVSPAIGATLHTFFFLNALMTELLPVFGYPINPTLICFRSLCSLPNCRKSWMRAPLPNGFVRLAWNAKVGCSWDKIAIHFCFKLYRLFYILVKLFLKIFTVIHVGTKSHLFNTKIMCLWLFSFCIYCSTCLHRVPSGLRASSTWIITSDESITLYNSPQILLLWPALNKANIASSLVPPLSTTKSLSFSALYSSDCFATLSAYSWILILFN